MININLLPSAQRQPLLVFDKTLGLGLAIIVAEIVAVVLFAIIVDVRISNINNGIAEWSTRVEAEQAAVKEVDDLRDQAQQLQAKADLLERIKQSPLQLAEILSDVSNNTPKGVWFTSLSINHATGGGGAVALQGKTSQYRQVADLMLNLDGSPIFGDATLTTTTQTTQGGFAGGGNVTFSVVGSLSPAVVGQ